MVGGAVRPLLLGNNSFNKCCQLEIIFLLHNKYLSHVRPLRQQDPKKRFLTTSVGRSLIDVDEDDDDEDNGDDVGDVEAERTRGML